MVTMYHSPFSLLFFQSLATTPPPACLPAAQTNEGTASQGGAFSEAKAAVNANGVSGP